ncbi:MAG: CDP-diacylglycerol--glycerol-3-phosphate 3-phosphatidyltransferase [Pseudomonadota bacterium]
MNIPILLTLLRIGMIPVFVVAFYLPFDWGPALCAVIFALAAATDWLDGWLARRLGQTSAFGAFLDPVADKLMVAVALVLIVQADPRPAIAIPAAVIIGREIAISALREWMAQVGARSRVSVVMVGKLKTVAQLVAITLMLYASDTLGSTLYLIGCALLYAATVLTLWSMTVYLISAIPVLREGGDVKERPARSK